MPLGSNVFASSSSSSSSSSCDAPRVHIFARSSSRESDDGVPRPLPVRWPSVVLLQPGCCATAKTRLA
jgi:hypothetical protein